MKKLLVLMLTLAMVCSCAAMAEGNFLTVGTEATFPPYEYYDGENLVGIDYEIADAIAKKLGYEGAKMVDMAFDSILPSVTKGNVDMAMAGLTANPERMNSVHFTFPYATGVQVVIVKEDSPIQTIEDMTKDGFKPVIGVQIATTGNVYADWDFTDTGLGKVNAYASGVDAVEALKNGKIDCVIIDNEPAQAYVAGNEGLKILDTAYAEESYAIAIAKDNVDLLGKVSAALQDLIADGTVQNIIDKYIKAE